MAHTIPVATQEQTDHPRQELLNQVIREVSHIATLPEVTLKIIDLVEDPESTAQDLHRVIANDPALSARVLKVVNSAFYALPGQIGSINRAIVLLGLNAVKNIAIAASLAKLFRGGRLTPEFAARDLWVHSIAVGTAVKLLSEQLQVGLPEEAFLAGLIHDIGIMVELQTNRPKLMEVLDNVHQNHQTFLDAEQRVWGGLNHQDFGQGLCRLWKFPATLAHVSGYHHRPLELDAEQRKLTALVYVADHLAAEVKIGYAHTVADPTICDDVLDELRLSSAMLDQVRHVLPEVVAATEDILG